MDSSSRGNQSAATYNPYLENQDKVALVAQLEAMYVRPDAASSFIRRPDPRRVTGWEQGIFYLPSRDILEDLVHDEMHVKWMGDMSKKFVTKMFERSNVSWNSPQLNAVKVRDKATCVVTGKQYTVAPASLIPSGLSAHMIPPCIFDDETTYRLTNLVKSLTSPVTSLAGRSINSSVSTLTLDWEMNDLFSEGWAGFRPVEITEDSDAATCHVNFAVHWFYPTMAKPNSSRRASRTSLQSMFALTRPGRQDMRRIQAYDSTGRRVCCGTIVRIPLPSRAMAQDMMDLLSLRWAASLVLFYAGGVGRLSTIEPVEEPAYRSEIAATTATSQQQQQQQHETQDEFELYDSGMDADDEACEAFRALPPVVTARSSRPDARGVTISIGRVGRRFGNNLSCLNPGNRL